MTFLSEMELTRRNLDVLNVVVGGNAYGYPPTVREIGAALGLSSPGTVQRHLDKLEALGLIERLGKRRRVTQLGKSVAA